MAVYPGKMVRDLAEDYDAFFAYGIGAMCWSIDEGLRVLYFMAPPTGYKNGGVKFTLGRIYTMRSEGNRAVPGNVNGWDGNLERPTFEPSIWLLGRKGWHGYIRNGDLVDA